MSLQLINHSSDLRKLQSDGYNIVIRSGYLIVKDVPYVNSQKEVNIASLVMALDVSGDHTTKPKSHVCMFTGELPCDNLGNPLTQIINQSREQKLVEDLVVYHTFSSKPKSGYIDYFHKVTSYVNMLQSFANQLNPGISAKTFPIIIPDNDDYPFNYLDTAVSRAGIDIISNKLKADSIAIIGLGGTGSYVLDFISKSPVKEIHIYDGDKFLNHNAFRAPGAPSIEELRAQPYKVTYLKNTYSKMHRKIIDHPQNIDKSNIDDLKDMSFVFLCIHASELKGILVDKLIEYNISFVDVGMGLYIENDQINGILRVTTITPSKNDHAPLRISKDEFKSKNEYSTNIQVSDLNALNACLAVQKWKKIRGFYSDKYQEHNQTFTIRPNKLISEDKIEEKKDNTYASVS